MSIIGANQVVGLEDLVKESVNFRKSKVHCVTEKAFVLFLSKEDYFTRFYRQMQKHVIHESKSLKEPFF